MPKDKKQKVPLKMDGKVIGHVEVDQLPKIGSLGVAYVNKDHHAEFKRMMASKQKHVPLMSSFSATFSIIDINKTNAKKG